MTTDDDRVAYLAGEAEADVDDVTRADLDELRGLLADPSVWAEPGPGLEDAIVAAITAEAAQGTAAPAAPAVARPTRRRSHRTRNVLTAVAAAAVLGIGGYVVVSSGSDDGATEVSMQPTDLLPAASGTAELRRTDSGWRIELDATGLPRLDDGRFYQAWLRNADDVLVAVGTFNEPHDVVLWAGVSPVEFSTLTVTEEQADGDQGSSGRRVLVGMIELDS
jgi:hypothetical protein